MNNPVATLLISYAAFAVIVYCTLSCCLSVDKIKRHKGIKIRYRGKTFVRHFNNECAKVNRGEK
mgnify:CR=1 FL=1